MTEPPPVSIALKALGIPHEVFIHPGQPKSLEQAAEERHQRPEQVVRSILFRESNDSYIMVLMAGPRRIDWKELRRTLGKSRVTMASKEEVMAVTGYEIGAVAPFGLSQPVHVIVDRSVLAEKTISMGSGVRNVAILLKSSDLMQGLGEVEVVTFERTQEDS